MLLVCSGEDTYRSLEKARELEAAFRSKYDPSGSSIERLPAGKGGVEMLLSNLAAASLFASRRFFRVDGVVAACPKDRQTALMQSLGRDVEATIVVTVEAGQISEKALKPFKALPKFIQYDYPPLSPAQFKKWCADYALKYGVKDMRAIQKIIEIAQGDTWLFVNEFQKWSSGGEMTSAAGKEPTVYDVIDSLLMSRPDRWSLARRFDDANGIAANIVAQTRSLALVQAGCFGGVHPYVAQKLSRMKITNPTERYLRLASVFAWSRAGQASAEEALDALG